MPGFHYAQPPAPAPMSSPTWSLSTLDSTILVTPGVPALALPPTTGVHLHAALAYRPGAVLPLVYDAVLDPRAIHAPGLDGAALRRVLGQGATSRAGPVVLRVDGPAPFFITIFPGTTVDGAASPVVDRIIPLPSSDGRAPAETARGAFVTVHALLAAIHLALHAPVPLTDAAVLAAMHARCAANPAEPRAPKRVDVLAAAGAGTRVLGLSATKGEGQWVLTLR